MRSRRCSARVMTVEPAVSLDALLQELFGLLDAAPADPASPFRTLALASIGLDGAPEIRSVVLRAFDAPQRRVVVHTDRRSRKFAELAQHPAVALHAWDPLRRLQLRLRGDASLHAGDATAQAEWQALRPLSRQLYRTSQPSGGIMADPLQPDASPLPEADAYACFVAVVIRFTRLESLALTEQAHIRARFDWAGDRLAAEWLAP